jgi:hypothetical protein
MPVVRGVEGCVLCLNTLQLSMLGYPASLTRVYSLRPLAVFTCNDSITSRLSSGHRTLDAAKCVVLDVLARRRRAFSSLASHARASCERDDG